jgi:hypothetical protein
MAATLAQGRAAALQLMTDKVVITRVTGQVYNPATMQYEPTTATVYTGPADVKPLNVGDREVQAGEREVALRTFDVRLPFDTVADLARGDLVTVTASGDASLVGRVLTVTGVGRGGRRTARHIDAEDRS